MGNMFHLIEDDASNGPALPSDDKIRRIGELAKRQVSIEKEISDMTERQAALQKELDELRDRTLSDLLLECGISELKLDDGSKVKVDRMVFATIKGDNKPAAISWLEGHGFGALVKSSLSINAEKGAGEKLAVVVAAAAEVGLAVTRKDDIHPQTLKAFCAEQLEKMDDFPQELFGVYVVNRTKIK